MRHVILFIISIATFIFSIEYAKRTLTIDGEYYASLHFIGGNITNIHIVTNMHKSDFISHSYLKSPSLNDTAIFTSTGSFTSDDSDGNYKITYIMKENTPPKILDPNNAKFYLSMVGRTGVEIEEEIRMIYHDRAISIFDMNRNGNIIMYSKKH
ncbi:hypothetical protein BTN33_02555 [Aeromonas veronii]|uniref:hypothetical protein n=1 Tax=Aeromonas veronii TaxID=654 RepID=UPI0009471C8D|nr:hypothetical protein [Aeromonas veronii]OLF60440.1 hypothetical protein BTN33_02555 [Aeromonas veronii]